MRFVLTGVLFCACSEAVARGHHELHNDHWSQAMRDVGARLLAEYYQGYA